VSPCDNNWTDVESLISSLRTSAFSVSSSARPIC